jgi:hypothetical protein
MMHPFRKLREKGRASVDLAFDDENGLLLERTIAYRPFPALKIFRDRLIALNTGKVPDDMWDYPKATDVM